MTQRRVIHKIKPLAFFILAGCLFFVSTSNVECKQTQKVFSTTATGTQTITSGFSTQIKKKAVFTALKSSVERAVSEVLSPEEFASNLAVLNKKVLLNPSKYIVNYSVVAELKEDTRYVVAVKVRVDLTLLKKYLKRYEIIKGKKEKPAVLLLISEKSEQDILPKHWWSKNSQPYESLVVNEITKVMLDKEFVVVGGGTQKVDFKKYGIVFSSVYDTAAALKLGKKLKADIIIVGKAKSFEALNKMGEEKIYEANIALDMFSVNTRQKITSFELKATDKNYDNKEGNKSALIKIGTLAAEEITTGVNKYWEESILKKEQAIETRIEGEDYLASFIQLRKALNAMPGIRNVQTKELGAGQALVSIRFKGSAEQLAQALLLKTFDSFGIEIYDVKDKSFTIKFVSK